MSLSHRQVDKLLNMVVSTEDDRLDCDGCFASIAEFADAKLLNHDLSEALKAVEIHLQQCQCCQGEFAALLDGLRSLDE